MKRLVLLMAVCASINALAAGQVGHISMRRIDRPDDSGHVSPVGRTEEAVYETVLQSPGAPWIRVGFGECQLPPGAHLEIIALADASVQRLDSKGLAHWNDSSAYFNGDGVAVRLICAPSVPAARVSIRCLWAGEEGDGGQQKSLCGPDNRVSSQDDRVCRLTAPTGSNTVSLCTGWRVTNGAFLTAGHCTDPLLPTVAEFYVPSSTSAGGIVWAQPEDQYPVDAASFTIRNAGVGSDWAVFGVFPNTTTGLHPNQAYGIPLRVTNYKPEPDRTVRITGFGADASPMSAGYTNQTSDGPYKDEYVGGPNDIDHEYFVDTQPGNSGGPIIWVLSSTTDVAIGVHTDGTCYLGIQGNLGTSSEVDDLEAALQRFPGPNMVYVDRNYPIDIDDNGTFYNPWREVGYAVKNAPSGAALSIVAGEYKAINGNTFTTSTPMLLTAPCGEVVIGK